MYRIVKGDTSVVVDTAEELRQVLTVLADLPGGLAGGVGVSRIGGTGPVPVSSGFGLVTGGVVAEYLVDHPDDPGPEAQQGSRPVLKSVATKGE